MTKPQTVEQYVEAATPEAQPLLRELLNALRQAVPDAEDSLKWGAPTFTFRRILFAVSAHKNHVAFAPTPAAIRAFADRLGKFETGKSTVKFPLGGSLPVDLVEEMAAWRLREVVENDAKWM